MKAYVISSDLDGRDIAGPYRSKTAARKELKAVVTEEFPGQHIVTVGGNSDVLMVTPTEPGPYFVVRIEEIDGDFS